MPDTAAASKQKDLGIQSLRGVAIILMVAGHVIGTTANSGLMVADDSGWRIFYRALEDLRMPLFTVLSGFVYAYRPVKRIDGMPVLAKAKVRRLLVPFFVVGTLFFFVQLVAPGVNNPPTLSDLPDAYIYGYQHFWFLQSIFLIFMLVGFLDGLGVMRSFPRWAAVTALSMVVFVFLYVPSAHDVFSIDGAIRLLPFFLLGYGAHIYGDELLRPRNLLISTVAFVPIYALRIWTIVDDVDLTGPPRRALSLAVGVLVIVTVLAVRQHLTSRFLAWLGGFSFGIYLLHVFGAAGMRAIATKLGVESTSLLFVLCLSAAIAGPIVFELLFGRYKLISWAVLGQKPRRPASALAPTEAKAPTGDSVS